MSELADDEPDATIVTDFVYDRNYTERKNLGKFVWMPLFPNQK